MRPRTNIDIGVIVAEGIRTTVAGGLVRSRQIRQAPAIGRDRACWTAVRLALVTDAIRTTRPHITFRILGRFRSFEQEQKPR
jgi:hypothetical protein